MFVQKVTYHIFVVGHLNRVSTSVCLLTVLFILSLTDCTDVNCIVQPELYSLCTAM